MINLLVRIITAPFTFVKELFVWWYDDCVVCTTFIGTLILTPVWIIKVFGVPAMLLLIATAFYSIYYDFAVMPEIIRNAPECAQVFNDSIGVAAAPIHPGGYSFTVTNFSEETVNVVCNGNVMKAGDVRPGETMTFNGGSDAAITVNGISTYSLTDLAQFVGKDVKYWSPL